MNMLKPLLLAGAFMSCSGLGNAQESQEPLLEYSALKPELVLHDHFATADLVFLEKTNLEDGSVFAKHGRFEPTMGLACQWDKKIKDKVVTIENVKCVRSDKMPVAWAQIEAKQFGDFVRLIGDSPRVGKFDPDVIFEVSGAVNSEHHVLMMTRIWDTKNSLACLVMKEGYQEVGNVYAEVDFGCYPITDKTYMNGLMQKLGM